MIRVTNNEQTVQITSNSTPAVISALNNDSKYYAEKASSAVAETTQNVSICEAMATIAKDSATQSESILATVQSHSATAIEKANIAVEASNQATSASLSAQASAVSAENSLEAAINAANNALASELRAKEYIEDIDKLEETVETVEAIAFEINEIADTLATIDLSNLSDVGQNKFDVKANTDLSNIDSTAKETISRLGMPSDRFDTLAIGASDTTYTAPADGYFHFFCCPNSDGYSQAWLRNMDNGLHDWGGTDVIRIITATLPVKKGSTVLLGYYLAGGVRGDSRLRFYYAEGVK